MVDRVYCFTHLGARHPSEDETTDARPGRHERCGAGIRTSNGIPLPTGPD